MGVLNWFIVIDSFLLIIFVILQDFKDDISEAFSGSKSDLFKIQKVRGSELFLQRANFLTVGLFILLSLIMMIINSK